ncbi:MAG: dipeptide ABC transporter ATP-binding protein [Candidatus Bipolaricaulia bacterium]
MGISKTGGGGGDDLASTPSGVKTISRRARRLLNALDQLYRKPASALGTTVVLLFVLIAIFGPLLTPYSATQQILTDARQGPSTKHWFGTDHLGRDVFSRVMLGTRSILALAGLGTLLAVIGGTIFGLTSGYRGGLFDEILMRSFDSLLAIPAVLLALLLLGTIGPSQTSVLIVIVVVYIPIVARVVRSEVLAIKTKGFVKAARLQGESISHILFREILPSVLPALSVEAALRFSYAIFLVSSLGFLGVGVQPPNPDWGLMVNEARTFVGLTPWALFFPAGAISLLIIGVNLMADGLKRVLQSPAVATSARAPDVSSPLRAEKEIDREEAVGTLSSAAAASASVLTIEDLTASYHQDGTWLDAVRDVSLRIEAGQTYGLVGESGSGKSTLALAIMRYLSENGAVRHGRIEFADHDLSILSQKELRRIRGSQINLVPQDPLSSLNPSLRVGEQIAEVLRHHRGLNSSQARARTVELLNSVRLADPQRVARSYPHQLSGGMQQRVMIAMALSTVPRFIVLDEPTTGLDVTTEVAVLDLFCDLIQERDMATLYVSHALGVVARFADRVAVLYAGELVEDASAQDLYRQPLHPYTQGLLDSVPRLGQNKSEIQLTSMPGQIPDLNDLPQGCVFAPRCPLAIEICNKRPPLEIVDGEDRRVRCHRWREILVGEVSAKQAAASETDSSSSQDDGAKPALVVKDLKRHFRLRTPLIDLATGKRASTVKAVNGVSLKIERGKTLGLVGESGSGKTTLANAIMGLEERSDGSIELLGIPLPRKLSQRDVEILRRLQIVFQNPEEALNPYLTIGETLRRPLMKLQRKSRREADAAVDELLEMVRLKADYAQRLPAQLSGGEKQRAAIARAFAASPELLIYDEPTSALDASVQARILNLLNELQRERRSAYLFISHDLATVGYLADEIAVIYLGRLMEMGRTEDFFAPPYHPYTEALLSAFPLIDPNAQQAPIRLEGEIPSPTNVPSGCPFHTRCPRFLGDICVEQEPPWQEDENGHRIYCHIPLDELRRQQKPAFRFQQIQTQTQIEHDGEDV